MVKVSIVYFVVFAVTTICGE